MKRMRGLLWGLVFLMGASCSSIRPGGTATLRVGFTPNYPPLAMLRNDKAAGVEIDFAEQLAQDLGMELELLSVPWERLFEELAAGNVDVIMSGMTVTLARRARAAFCEPYMSNPLIAVVRREESGRYATAEEVKAATGGIGFLEATSAGTFVRREFKAGKALPLSTPEDAAFHLVNQRIDLYVDDLAAAVDIVSRHETQLELVPIPLHEQELAWAVRPGDEELKRQANEALARWRASGWLDETLDRWMPYRKALAAIAAK